jgi:hypothetical protein
MEDSYAGIRSGAFWDLQAAYHEAQHLILPRNTGLAYFCFHMGRTESYISPAQTILTFFQSEGLIVKLVNNPIIGQK